MIGDNKRAWAEANLANVRMRERERMEVSKQAARDGLFIAASHILLMHVEQLLEAEDRLFKVICEEKPKDEIDRQIEKLINEESK